jgi:hypothetical protein
MMTIKEWAAEYQRINEAEREDRKQRLPLESVENSLRAYFGLACLAQSLALPTSPPNCGPVVWRTIGT